MSMNADEILKALKYYGTTYAIGDNLGREIQGTDKVILDAVEIIKQLGKDVQNKDLTISNSLELYSEDEVSEDFKKN